MLLIKQTLIHSNKIRSRHLYQVCGSLCLFLSLKKNSNNASRFVCWVKFLIYIYLEFYNITSLTYFTILSIVLLPGKICSVS